MNEHTQSDVLIVGAGIAGLMAARTVAQQGAQVTLVESTERVGGRLATRAIGPGRADCGAQFFTARTPEFQNWVDRWLEDGLAFEWSRGWSSGSLGTTPSEGHPRYAVRGGMLALAEHLAQGLDVRRRSRLVSVMLQRGHWVALDERGQRYSASALILALPVPQALQLLDTGHIPLKPANRAALEAIQYEPCLGGLFWVNGEVHLPEPGAIQHPNAPITWIADNRQKGISPEATIITVHAGASYSRDLWRLPDRQVLVALESGLRLFKEFRTEIVEAHLERWPHAMPAATHSERCLLADDLPPLVFAGDAFGGPRVEGAALSGLAARVALAAGPA
ncbi:MAG TPA: FAD-dependent oxidoreductase [Aggregatilineaceae bacterium]|nr:FAD-dependent oxidoreductase [Aggregatilineaceae bacterium]